MLCSLHQDLMKKNSTAFWPVWRSSKFQTRSKVPPDKRHPPTVLVFVLVFVFVIVLVPPAPDTQQAATYSIAAVEPF